MTRDDYRKIKAALRRPHTLNLIHKDNPNIVINVYHSCEELCEYYGSPYDCAIVFLDNVVQPIFDYVHGEEVDYFPF